MRVQAAKEARRIDLIREDRDSAIRERLHTLFEDCALAGCPIREEDGLDVFCVLIESLNEYWMSREGEGNASEEQG